MPQQINLAIIGASGLVGRTMLNILLERNFPAKSIKLFASKKSAGKIINVSDELRNKCKPTDEFIIEELSEKSFDGMDIALFSAGAEVSKKYVPVAVDSGCIVIDNGSYWRMHADVPLVVPEVNPDDIFKHKGIIANPNCSTIQLVVVLNALLKYCDIKRVVVCTYQAVSGGGQKWLDKYQSEMAGIPNDDKYKIFNSIMFHSAFNNDGNTIEEEKMLTETRKILHRTEFHINATCVRLPIENSHCEAVNIEFNDFINLNEIKEILLNSDGITFIDDAEGDYPTPLLANGKDDVFVGRLRRDNSNPNTINLWIVADNPRKGAATNAVQIAEKLLTNK